MIKNKTKPKPAKKASDKAGPLKVPSWFSSKLARPVSFIRQHPMLTAVGVYLLYFLVLQTRFLFSTDVWAETHMEYLDEAIKQSFWETFGYGWAGYLTFIPSLAAKFYVMSHLPLGYADVFFQIIIVLTAILIAGFTVSKFNRALFKSDLYRLLLGLTFILLLYEKSVFSIINIWYLGFVPLILIALNPDKLSKTKQVWYSLFGVLMALTKPSLFIIPFVAYRAVKTREWLSNGLIMAAALVQTWVMLNLDPRQSAANATHDLGLIMESVFVGGATEIYKLFRVVPESYAYIVLANLVLVGLLILVWKRLGLMRTGLLLIGYFYSAYSYVLAPDAVVYSNPQNFRDIYYYNFKVQREYLIFVFILLILFFALPALLALFKRFLQSRRVLLTVRVLSFTSLVLLTARLYMPIDVESAGVAANISTFRHSINSGQSVCVPLPPTPAYYPHTLWHFDFNAKCIPQNFEFSPDYRNLNVPLNQGVRFTVPNNTLRPLKTVYVVVRNQEPERPALLTLRDNFSGVEYTAVIPKRQSETINFMPINVSGLPYRQNYSFTLTSDSKRVSWGHFKENNRYIYYPFFAATRPVLFSR